MRAIYKPITIDQWLVHFTHSSSSEVGCIHAPFTSSFLYKLQLFLHNCPLSILFAGFGMSGIRKVWWTVLFLPPPFPSPHLASLLDKRISRSAILMAVEEAEFALSDLSIAAVWDLYKRWRGHRQSVPQDKNSCDHGSPPSPAMPEAPSAPSWTLRVWVAVGLLSAAAVAWYHLWRRQNSTMAFTTSTR